MTHPALHIASSDIQAILSSAYALLAKPSRDSVEWLNLLVAIDRIEGCDALADTISDLESDLGLGNADEPQCLACGTDCKGRCDQAYDDRTSYGMAR